jgi:flagellar hook-length control protein FliK
MDKKFLNSLFTGEAQQHLIPDRRQWEQRDLSHDLARNFSSVFNQELEKEDEKEVNKDGKEGKEEAEKNEQQEASNKLIDDNRTKEQEQKEAVKTESVEKLQAELQEHVRERLTNLLPMLNYLYNLMYKNPDALTLLEKKAAGLDKLEEMDSMKKHDVEYLEFKKMLEKRGLKIEDLTLANMKKLVQHKNREELESFLDKLVNEKRDELKNQGKKEISDKKDTKDEQIQRTGIENRNNLSERPAEALDHLKNLAGRETSRSENEEKIQKHRELVDKIIQRIDVRKLNERTELVMKLNPEFMGDLKLKLDYRDNKISALFETTSKNLRDMLNESSRELAEAFREKSLNLTDTRVILVESVDEV